MGETERVSVEYEAKLDDFRAQLAKMPGYTDKSAKATVAALDRQLAAATRAAKASAKSQAGSFKTIEGGLSSLKKAASGIGGPLYGAVDTFEDLFESATKAGSVMGPAGILVGGLAAIGVGAYAAHSALQSMIGSAEMAAGRLQEMGLDAEIPPAALASIQEYNAQVAASAAASDVLAVTTAGPLAEAFGKAEAFFTGAKLALAGYSEESEETSATQRQLWGAAEAVAGVLTLGALPALIATTEATAEAGREFRGVAEDAAFMGEAYAALGMVIDETTSKTQRHTGEVMATREQLAALFDAELAAMDLGALRNEQIAATNELLQEQTDLTEALTDATVRETEEGIAGLTAELEKFVSGLERIGTAKQELTDAVVSGVGSLASSLGSLAEEGSTAYKALFVAQQAAGAAAVIIDTQRAVMAALTIPPPAGEISAASRAITGGAALAAILATTIVGLGGGGKHHAGLDPREVPATLLRGEGVLTQQGVRNMGGAEAVARVNAGAGGSSGGVVLVKFGHKLFDAS